MPYEASSHVEHPMKLNKCLNFVSNAVNENLTYFSENFFSEQVFKTQLDEKSGN